LLDPANRRRQASLKHDQARQRPEQSIRAFVDYLEVLEADLEPLTERQKADAVFNKVHPDIRRRLIENTMATKEMEREELVSLITMMESTEKKKKPTEQTTNSSKTNSNTHSSFKSNRFPYQQHQREAREKPENSAQKNSEKEKEGNTSKQQSKLKECFFCHKKGHLQKDCYAKKRQEETPRVAAVQPATSETSK